MARIVLPAAAAGKRLDSALAAALKVSRSQAQALIADGRVLLGGTAPKSSHLVEGKEALEVDDSVLANETPDVPTLDVVYEDDDLFVINKPAGLVVHPTESKRPQPTVSSWAASRVDDPDEPDRPGIVHRLDKDTSGLLIIAKHPAAKQSLQALFRDHQIHKTYQALVVGALDEAEATINLPIARSRQQPTKRAVLPGGRPSTTHYRTLAVYPGATLIEVELETGRTHQIRVHFSHLGHPVVGDELYGGRPSKTDHLPRIQRQWLHATHLKFVGPSGQTVDLIAALPPDLSDYLELLNPQPAV